MFTRFIKGKALVYSTAFLMLGQTAAAGQELPRLTPSVAQHLSHDLISPHSQDFFFKGQDSLDREIQILRRRHSFSNKPILKIDTIPQVEKDGEPKVLFKQ